MIKIINFYVESSGFPPPLSPKDVDMVTNEEIKETTRYLKSPKNEPVFHFNSDCLKHAPSILCEHLATLIKSVLIYEHVNHVLLLATLVPIM